jgi:hypothetical protein
MTYLMAPVPLTCWRLKDKKYVSPKGRCYLKASLPLYGSYLGPTHLLIRACGTTWTLLSQTFDIQHSVQTILPATKTSIFQGPTMANHCLQTTHACYLKCFITLLSSVRLFMWALIIWPWDAASSAYLDLHCTSLIILCLFMHFFNISKIAQHAINWRNNPI